MYIVSGNKIRQKGCRKQTVGPKDIHVLNDVKIM